MNEKLYGELASWWPLLSSPDDYEEEAEFFLKHFGGKDGSTMLELGSGGGNIASWLKEEYEMTLVDSSPAMLAVSQDLNPDCVHIEGDMRSIRLNQIFDRVFIHVVGAAYRDRRNAVAAFGHLVCARAQRDEKRCTRR